MSKNRLLLITSSLDIDIVLYGLRRDYLHVHMRAGVYHRGLPLNDDVIPIMHDN